MGLQEQGGPLFPSDQHMALLAFQWSGARHDEHRWLSWRIALVGYRRRLDTDRQVRLKTAWKIQAFPMYSCAWTSVLRLMYVARPRNCWNMDTLLSGVENTWTYMKLSQIPESRIPFHLSRKWWKWPKRFRRQAPGTNGAQMWIWRLEPVFGNRICSKYGDLTRRH